MGVQKKKIHKESKEKKWKHDRYQEEPQVKPRPSSSTQ